MNKRKKISKNENKKTKKICELVKNDENSYLLNESFYECGKIKKILKTNYLKDSLFVLADNVIKVYSVFTSPMIFDQSINNPLNNVDEIMRFTNHNDEVCFF